MRVPQPIRALALPPLLAMAVAGCGSNSTSGAPGSGGAAVTVTAHDFSFDAPSGSVTPGASISVSFMNAGAVQHSFTLDSGGQEVVADGGSTQTLTFTAPASGSVAFHCKFHASMHGTIAVGSGAATAATTATGGGGRYGGGNTNSTSSGPYG